MKTSGQLAIAYRAAADLVRYERNARTHSAAQVEQLKASLRRFGWTNPALVAGDDLLAGHGRLEAATQLWAAGESIRHCPVAGEVPTGDLSHLSADERRAYILADNKLAENAGWDVDLLAIELADLRDADFDLSVIGFDAGDLAELLDPPRPSSPGAGAGSLAERFMVAPFSTLNARDAAWQDRKRGWLALGIQSELGRDAPAYAGASDHQKADRGAPAQHRTSIFDPVLCELAYRWFCPADGLVLDPFAGGSVRGIVSARLGRQYIGMDLRAEQVAANRGQLDLLRADDPAPAWHVGDSRKIGQHLADVEADFVFSCPPYADLERYSDDPADLSTMDYPAFVKFSSQPANACPVRAGAESTEIIWRVDTFTFATVTDLIRSTLKAADDRPSIGLLLCKENNRLVRRVRVARHGEANGRRWIGGRRIEHDEAEARAASAPLVPEAVASGIARSRRGWRRPRRRGWG